MTNCVFCSPYLYTFIYFSFLNRMNKGGMGGGMNKGGMGGGMKGGMGMNKGG